MQDVSTCLIRQNAKRIAPLVQQITHMTVRSIRVLAQPQTFWVGSVPLFVLAGTLQIE